ncbi:hypothetical protein [uncultured Methanobrevibacter sp.]|uniref:hypothetical protein n=1 Tax=uncultured Methanobrevibacter sp. TaxID=253161 RepID=UPI0025FDF91B|nr:hypothetical protein [uncultured Methanobrevibacter sp.]
MTSEIKNKLNNLKNKEGRKKFLIEIACIAFGTIVGIATYVLCLYTNFAIFGWNFGLVLSPLFAGYAESFVAKRYLHESTGAVSAFILFIITVIYGFIIANPTLGFNVITAGSIVIIIQAAFPTAMNYFLIAMGLGIVSHLSGVFKKITKFFTGLYERIFKKESKVKKAYQQKQIYGERQINHRYDFYDMELNMNDLGVRLLTLEYPPEGLKIKEQKGIYISRHIFSSNRTEEIKEGLEDQLEENVLIGVKLAQDKAILKLIKELKADGCNGIMNLEIIFDTVGPKKGDNVNQVFLKGTGVVFEEDGI